ncbi:lantibiotic dehydratase [Anoxybacillus flavithermus]|uniref:Lantibiotic dehydratase n=2 Tax=Anoxybacillus flavithermus TaxID=33934 RepID=R4G1K5_9BACL|nr:lantibiotic dehydratase [Anoxybacillus flavithermus]ACJ34797.1 Lantibiotic dehydratase [Anoxybacillus flavithermus WK1]AST06271.1 lantibiotic dehydratase [Anoxybacillus flavithermus]GAC91619.1 lantibiotic dehydratase [Anoxybacillus flavithermus NBRC 109594]
MKSKNSQTHTFSALDNFMVRTPILPIDSIDNVTTKQDLFKLVDNPLFLEAIAIASDDLYQYIKRGNYTKENFFLSILRYYIRMASRPTPFGLFAAVSVGTFGDHCEVEIPDIEMFKKRSRPDMAWIFKLVKKLDNNLSVLNQLKVHQNPALYYSGDIIKLPYITEYGESKFEIASFSINKNSLLDSILKKTEEPIEVQKLIMEFPELDKLTLLKAISLFVNREVLITNLRPPLSGNIAPLDYLIQQLQNISGIDDIKNKLLQIKSLISTYDSMPVGKGEKFYIFIQQKMNELLNTSSKNYLQVDLYNPKELMLNKEIRSEVEKAADLLFRLASKNSMFPHLDEYLKQFKDFYGTNQEIPILNLLDNSELGAPSTYKHPVSDRNENQEIVSNNIERERYLQEWILEALNNNSLELPLNDEKIKLIENKTPKKAQSLDLLLTISSKSIADLNKGDFQIILHEKSAIIGAGRSFGRFTNNFSKKFKENFINIMKYESKDESDIIYADLIYLHPNGRSANVTLSEVSRQTVLVLGTNTSKEFRTLTLDDIVVGCSNDKFYLKSKSLQKEVIITSNNMLNFHNSPNVIRFLREISIARQGVIEGFNWGKLEEMIFLPRLTYGKIILRPAEWKLFKQKSFLEGEEKYEIFCIEFEKWKNNWKLPRYVNLKTDKQKLLLDLNNHLHLNILFKEYQKLQENKFLRLIELGYQFDNNLITNNRGSRFQMEAIFSLVNVQESIKDDSISKKIKIDKTYIPLHERIYLPGGEWLYLKIYIINCKQDDFILENIFPLISSLQEDNFKEFYFIRYNDPEQHFRIRIKGDTEYFIPKIFKWANKLKNNNKIKKIVLDTYNPEIERYGGPLLIEKAENIFYQDSLVAINWVKMKNDFQISKLVFGVLNVIDYLENFNFSLEEQLEFIEGFELQDNFTDDFRKEKNTIFDLIKNKNSKKPSSKKEMANQLFCSRKKSIYSYNQAYNSNCNVYTTKERIVKSFIHLSLNRLGFNKLEEMKVYALTKHTVRTLYYNRDKQEKGL